MKKTETLFILAILTGGIAIAGASVMHRTQDDTTHALPDTAFGNFLAAQHAIYVNDFDRAAGFAEKLPNMDTMVVQNTKIMADFLNGTMPATVNLLGDEAGAAARVMYDVYLAQDGKWDDVYRRHKNDESALAAPLRIWSAVASGRSKEALAFIDKLPTNDSWKAFVRGQIAAETGDTETAARHFADVSPDFMNINDYLYIMAFYAAHDMGAATDELHDAFTTRPGGMYLSTSDAIPSWETMRGPARALAFGLVQNVSHTQAMMYSDLAILMLRSAQILAPDLAGESGAINYYLGQYFYNNGGDFNRYFSQISKQSPYYMFAHMRNAEKTGEIRELERALRTSPLFVPAVNTVIAHHVSHGNFRTARRVINRAIDAAGDNDMGVAFFKKSRAHINFLAGDLAQAQADLHDAAEILPHDAEILALQARIWAAENRELETAYEYAMTLVRLNPTDILGWDVLGVVVAAREGDAAALEFLERVGDVANARSSLYEQLGDIYSRMGDTTHARDAYLRAIDLADDGLVVMPNIRKKIRKLK